MSDIRELDCEISGIYLGQDGQDKSAIESIIFRLTGSARMLLRRDQYQNWEWAEAEKLTMSEAIMSSGSVDVALESASACRLAAASSLAMACLANLRGTASGDFFLTITKGARAGFLSIESL